MAKEPTHRVTGYFVRSRSIADGGTEQFEPGDEIAPTEREQRNFAHLLEPLDGADDDADADDGEDEEPVADEEDGDDAASDGGESDADEEADTSDEEDTEDADDEPAETVEDFPFSVEQIESAEYPRLRTMASQIDGVDGRAGEDEIRQGLLEKARGE